MQRRVPHSTLQGSRTGQSLFPSGPPHTVALIHAGVLGDRLAGGTRDAILHETMTKGEELAAVGG